MALFSTQRWFTGTTNVKTPQYRENEETVIEFDYKSEKYIGNDH